MIKILITIILIIYLFLVLNSIIWIQRKKITNINDKIIVYIIYLNFIIISGLLILYTPAVGWVGTDEFTYTIQDLAGNVSPPATVTVTVEL